MSYMQEKFRCVVQAGHLAYSEDPAFLCAVCGNGVAVTLRVQATSIGGMVHVVYPRLEPGSHPTNFHVETALCSLIKIIMDLRMDSGRSIEAQIYGGGHLNGVGKKRAEECIQAIRKILKINDIRIVSQDVGGTLGRKIIFCTNNGDTAVVKTSRIRRMDWLPEWEYQIGVKRIAYERGE